MEYLNAILGIAVIHFFAVSSPGPTFFVVASYANAGDRRACLLVVLGVLGATLTWASLAAIGLGAILNASTWLPLAIRMAGGAYLAWFGFKMLRSAWKGGAELKFTAAAATRVPALKAIRAGYITNISNPKVIAYYTSLFGVMVPPDAPSLLFAGAVLTALTVAGVWWVVVSLFFGLPAVRDFFTRTRRLFDALVGGLLVAFGAKLIAGL
jgi:threonine efflux protein